MLVGAVDGVDVVANRLWRVVWGATAAGLGLGCDSMGCWRGGSGAAALSTLDAAVAAVGGVEGSASGVVGVVVGAGVGNCCVGTCWIGGAVAVGVRVGADALGNVGLE